MSSLVTKFKRRLAQGLQTPDVMLTGADDEFIDQCFETFLGRPVDDAGREHYRRSLAGGLPRIELIQDLVASREYKANLVRNLTLSGNNHAIADLRELRPERYIGVKDILSGIDVLVYQAKEPEDFDWLERMILEHGYYDRMNDWVLGVDDDKRLLADMAAFLEPESCLEIGCSSGAVLMLLEAQGIPCEGIEISHLAMTFAPSQRRRRIHFGDLLELDLEPGYDLIMGMDIFEHFNPNRLWDYINRCSELLRPGGRLFTNIPAYGDDRVFGEVHRIFLQEWDESARQGRRFSQVHVDGRGWPIHGHLIWAATQWWEEQFAAAGLVRDEGCERSMHERFREQMSESADARRSFYVFVKAG